MTEGELGRILSEMCFNAPHGYKMTNMHLFGVMYASEIEDEELSIKAIVRAAGLQDSCIAEVSKGVKLARYVQPK